MLSRRSRGHRGTRFPTVIKDLPVFYAPYPLSLYFVCWFEFAKVNSLGVYNIFSFHFFYFLIFLFSHHPPSSNTSWTFPSNIPRDVSCFLTRNFWTKVSRTSSNFITLQNMLVDPASKQSHSTLCSSSKRRTYIAKINFTTFSNHRPCRIVIITEND